MRETNHAIYYTTAQVKDMVEISDQNVRKYVRMLEERKYEVAKDEHNRRLFSQEDIAVLKEFIKLAKQPGYTLETAAEEIIERVPHIVSEKGENTPANITNNDINHMLGAVMEKLDTMQQENRELKHNVHHLVERLEAYSKYNEPLTLEYRNSNAKPDAADRTTEDNDLSERELHLNEEVTAFEEVDKEEGVQDAPSEEKETAEQPETYNVDMMNYGKNEEDADTPNDTPTEEVAERSDGKEEEKGGYFSKLFNIFKK